MRFAATLLPSATVGASTVQVRALLFYEGAHTDSIGKKIKYSADKVRAIADATNELGKKRRLKFFRNHEYNHEDVLGAIVGPVVAQEITEVPQAGLEDLIGKIGIYGDVEIAGTENVAAYSEKRLKELSVGIDLKGDLFGVPGAIYELSAVGIPALAGAALFGVNLQATIDEIAAQKGQGRLMDALDEAWWAFRRTIADIGESGGEDAPQLMLQAARDFSALLLAQFALNNPPPEELPPDNPLVPTPAVPTPTVPLFNQAMELTPEQIKELQDKAAQYDAASAELEQVKRQNVIATRFSALKDKAIGLRDAGKLTPAKFKELGFETAEASVAKYSAGDDRELDKLEIKLEAIEEYATPVKMGLATDGEPIPGEEGNAGEDAATKFMANYSPTLRYSQTRSF